MHTVVVESNSLQSDFRWPIVGVQRVKLDGVRCGRDPGSSWPLGPT